MDTKPKKPISDPTLLVGHNVEVRSLDEGFIGSWHWGIVIECDKGVRKVQYKNMLHDDKSQRRNDVINVHPVVDGVTSAGRMRLFYRGLIRPIPPPLSFDRLSLRYGQCVDAYYREAWWEGVLFDNENASNVRSIFFPDVGDLMRISVDNLRITQDWDEYTQDWKPRRPWQFLELIKQFEKENLLHVSIRQIWYEVREKKDFQLIKEWTNSVTKKDIWGSLVREVIYDHSKLAAEKYYEEVAESVSSMNCEYQLIKLDAANNDGVNAVCDQNSVHGDYLNVVCDKNEGHGDDFKVVCDKNEGHGDDLNVVCEKKEIHKDDLNLVCYQLPSNGKRKHKRKRKAAGSEVTTVKEIHGGDLQLVRNRRRSKRGPYQKLNWQIAGKNIVPEAEFCPDSVLEYLKRSDKGKSSASWKLKLRKHLTYLGWKVEYCAGDDGRQRFRYTSPAGELYMSLINVCKALKTSNSQGGEKNVLAPPLAPPHLIEMIPSSISIEPNLNTEVADETSGKVIAKKRFSSILNDFSEFGPAKSVLVEEHCHDGTVYRDWDTSIGQGGEENVLAPSLPPPHLIETVPSSISIEPRVNMEVAVEASGRLIASEKFSSILNGFSEFACAKSVLVEEHCHDGTCRGNDPGNRTLCGEWDTSISPSGEKNVIGPPLPPPHFTETIPSSISNDFSEFGRAKSVLVEEHCHARTCRGYDPGERSVCWEWDSSISQGGEKNVFGPPLPPPHLIETIPSTIPVKPRPNMEAAIEDSGKLIACERFPSILNGFSDFARAKPVLVGEHCHNGTCRGNDPGAEVKVVPLCTEEEEIHEDHSLSKSYPEKEGPKLDSSFPSSSSSGFHGEVLPGAQSMNLNSSSMLQDSNEIGKDFFHLLFERPAEETNRYGCQISEPRAIPEAGFFPVSLFKSKREGLERFNLANISSSETTNEKLPFSLSSIVPCSGTASVSEFSSQEDENIVEKVCPDSKNIKRRKGKWVIAGTDVLSGAEFCSGSVLECKNSKSKRGSPAAMRTRKHLAVPCSGTASVGEVSSQEDENVVEKVCPDSRNNKRRKRKWEIAGTDVVPGAEFCPGSVLECKKSKSKRGSPVTMRMRKHLAYLGWKLEICREEGFPRMRYMSPEKKRYMSLATICDDWDYSTEQGKKKNSPLPCNIEEPEDVHESLDHCALLGSEKMLKNTSFSGNASFGELLETGNGHLIGCDSLAFQAHAQGENNNGVERALVSEPQQNVNVVDEALDKSIDIPGFSSNLQMEHGEFENDVSLAVGEHQNEVSLDTLPSGVTNSSVTTAREAFKFMGKSLVMEQKQDTDVADEALGKLIASTEFPSNRPTELCEFEKAKSLAVGDYQSEVPQDTLPSGMISSSVTKDREAHSSSKESLLSDPKQNMKIADEDRGKVDLVVLTNTQMEFDEFEMGEYTAVGEHQIEKTDDVPPCSSNSLDQMIGHKSCSAEDQEMEEFASGPFPDKKSSLSMLINSGVVSPGTKVYYYVKRSGVPLKEGKVTHEGIVCNCCQNVFGLSKFEAHAGSTMRRPAAHIILEDGRSLSQCQLELKSCDSLNKKLALPRQPRSDSEKIKKIATPSSQPKRSRVLSTNDSICSVCQLGGKLILCHQCPSSFHQECLGLKVIPDGEWFCPSCCCGICWRNKFNTGAKKIMEGSVLNCHQCERIYHVGCLFKVGDTNIDRRHEDKWFCNKKCEQVFLGLHKLLGRPVVVGDDNLTWTLLKYTLTNDLDADMDTMEILSNLNLAVSLMHECFGPLKEPRTKTDIAKDVIFSRGSNVKRLNFQGFYTVLLSRDDELISVAAVRVFGEKVAEVPLIGTRFQYRRQGMCRLLMKELEKKLMEVGVERLVVPATLNVLNTWTKSFGLLKTTESERLNFLRYTFLDFPGTSMCHKTLTPPAPSINFFAGIQQNLTGGVGGSDNADTFREYGSSETSRVEQIEDELIHQGTNGSAVTSGVNGGTGTFPRIVRV